MSAAPQSHPGIALSARWHPEHKPLRDGHVREVCRAKDQFGFNPTGPWVDSQSYTRIKPNYYAGRWKEMRRGRTSSTSRGKGSS